MQYNVLLRQEGQKMMTGRYRYTYIQQLNNLIDELIVEQGDLDEEGYHLNFDDLIPHDKTNIIALKIETNDRDCLDCFYEREGSLKNDNIINVFLTLLKHDSQYKREEFVDLILSNSISLYRESIQELIDDRCEWLSKEHHELKGFNE